MKVEKQNRLITALRFSGELGDYLERYLDVTDIAEIRGAFEMRFNKISHIRDSQSGEYTSQMTNNYWYGFLAASALYRVKGPRSGRAQG